MPQVDEQTGLVKPAKLWETRLQLHPEAHTDSVDFFHEFFKLHAQNPRLDFLEKILGAFSRLPYENVSKILKLNRYFDEADRRIRLPEEVISDHVNRHLGGTCFALTYFLQAILIRNGFQTYPVMAHMRAGQNIHTANIVILGGKKFLVDPGYLLNHPMEFNPARRRLYKTAFTGVELRFDPGDGWYNLFTFDRAEVKWRYRFRDVPVSWAEFLRHWQASFFRPSMHGISLTRTVPGGLIFVHKNFMREVRFGEKRNIRFKKNDYALVSNIFGIREDLIAEAAAALNENLELERRWGVFKPKETRL